MRVKRVAAVSPDRDHGYALRICGREMCVPQTLDHVVDQRGARLDRRMSTPRLRELLLDLGRTAAIKLLDR
jgi:hypothetical protein